MDGEEREELDKCNWSKVWIGEREKKWCVEPCEQITVGGGVVGVEREENGAGEE